MTQNADPEPDRNTHPYLWTLWWHRQPGNQDMAREVGERYIAAMQRDKNLD